MRWFSTTASQRGARRRHRPREPDAPPAHHRYRGAGLAIAIALALAACSGDDPSSPPPDATTSTTLVTAPASDPEAEVEQAYLAFWDMAIRLAHDPDPDDPEIHERASGQARDNLIDGLTTLRTTNQRSVLGDLYTHDVVSIDIAGDTAILMDCAVDDSRIVNITTGDVAVEGIGTELLLVEVTLTDGVWMVESIVPVDQWDEATSCR